MRTNLKYLSIVLIAATSITGCKKDGDDPIVPPLPTNEEELITTLRLHFRSANDVEHFQFAFIDLDGDGGNAPLFATDTLSADSIYTVEIEVLDESGTTVDDITAEILAEDEDHQFFFQVTGVNTTVGYSDADSNGNPIGISTAWNVGAAGSGSVTVTLIHEPDKEATGVSGGDITNAGGETDIEISFPLVIE